ncbi:hypothetical protein PaG_05114 [Moesziomyces aphidis]|uniref:Exosomal 3'-5' exoribonuclease complex, subunit Rrp41 n=2 Tax=Moesziomyces TaxID=63261 RepID=M9LUE0_PSEA3|nr:hypothetical protein PaG_05114 [Moesziomyces aphidis]GAC72799.1 exosomal 3'-5' exoribonuclease complex, subunit Rrp41 [Moesziomyces antarcticus T-34]
MVLGFGHHSQRDPNVKGEERGRDPFIATGRGGAGNIIRSPSRSRDRSGNAIPQQTAAAAAVPAHMISSGRGGAGNVRSPSRDPLDRKRAAEVQAREDKLQEEYRQQDLKAPHSTGRGGAGNIAADAEERGRGRGDSSNGGGGGGVSGLLRSLSRSRSREPRGGKESPKNRSQSRPRASESSKLAQVDESARSSEEESAYTHSTHTANNSNGHHPGAL